MTRPVQSARLEAQPPPRRRPRDPELRNDTPWE